MRPRLVPPAADVGNRKKLLNFLYLHERDHLFVWFKTVRVVDEAEWVRKRRAA